MRSSEEEARATVRLQEHRWAENRTAGCNLCGEGRRLGLGPVPCGPVYREPAHAKDQPRPASLRVRDNLEGEGDDVVRLPGVGEHRQRAPGRRGACHAGSRSRIRSCSRSLAAPPGRSSPFLCVRRRACGRCRCLLGRLGRLGRLAGSRRRLLSCWPGRPTSLRCGHHRRGRGAEPHSRVPVPEDNAALACGANHADPAAFLGEAKPSRHAELRRRVNQSDLHGHAAQKLDGKDPLSRRHPPEVPACRHRDHGLLRKLDLGVSLDEGRVPAAHEADAHGVGRHAKDLQLGRQRPARVDQRVRAKFVARGGEEPRGGIRLEHRRVVRRARGRATYRAAQGSRGGSRGCLAQGNHARKDLGGQLSRHNGVTIPLCSGQRLGTLCIQRGRVLGSHGLPWPNPWPDNAPTERERAVEVGNGAEGSAAGSDRRRAELERHVGPVTNVGRDCVPLANEDGGDCVVAREHRVRAHHPPRQLPPAVERRHERASVRIHGQADDITWPPKRRAEGHGGSVGLAGNLREVLALGGRGGGSHLLGRHGR
mmetsp:Transcript_15228/g.57481  ORF Transcript_15228/g.57481 Transcript_15228/m.57481 type:complete len:538 (+) Transcript_15228:127-1740(+)